MSESTNETRRKVIVGAGMSGLAALVAACSGGSETTGASQESGGSGAGSEAGSGSGTGSGSGSGSGSGGGSGALAKTSDIPVGGGKVFKDQQVVVTQPTEGTFKAFDATCTHQGCPVGSVADNVIVCPCHNSRFSAEDGSVQQGPATEPLTEKQITVNGDEITLS